MNDKLRASSKKSNNHLNKQKDKLLKIKIKPTTSNNLKIKRSIKKSIKSKNSLDNSQLIPK